MSTYCEGVIEGVTGGVTGGVIGGGNELHLELAHLISRVHPL